MTLYNLRAYPHHYTMTRFDADLNPVVSYDITLHADGSVSCNCPASRRPGPCKHRRMLPLFLDKSRQNTGWMYDHELAEWRQLVGEQPEISEENCPGHIASADPKVCARCGTHIDSLRPPEDDFSHGYIPFGE